MSGIMVAKKHSNESIEYSRQININGSFILL